MSFDTPNQHILPFGCACFGYAVLLSHVNRGDRAAECEAIETFFMDSLAKAT
jgi:hypothetical protein